MNVHFVQTVCFLSRAVTLKGTLRVWLIEISASFHRLTNPQQNEQQQLWCGSPRAAWRSRLTLWLRVDGLPNHGCICKHPALTLHFAGLCPQSQISQCGEEFLHLLLQETVAGLRILVGTLCIPQLDLQHLVLLALLLQLLLQLLHLSAQGSDGGLQPANTAHQ